MKNTKNEQQCAIHNVKSSAWVIFDVKNKTIMWVSLTEDGAKNWIKEMIDTNVLFDGECVYESVSIV